MYESNPDQYFIDQMTRFESFEGELYAEGIKKTIDYLFPDETRTYGERAKLTEVLDFCCGDGTTSQCLYEKGFRVVGFDGNKNKIHKARVTTDGDIDYVHMSAEFFTGYGCNDKFQIIYASHCFEHFLNPIGILKSSRNRLLPNGFIIIILPYPNESSEGHPGSNALRLNGSLEDVKNNLTENGFEVIKIEQVNFREPEIIIHLK